MSEPNVINGCPDISLKTTDVNFMSAQEEMCRYHQSHLDSSSGDLDRLLHI